jgi:hypothetical protein
VQFPRIMATIGPPHHDYFDSHAEHPVEDDLARPAMLSILVSVILAAVVAAVLVYALR